jgi:hypothetical protein
MEAGRSIRPKAVLVLEWDCHGLMLGCKFWHQTRWPKEWARAAAQSHLGRRAANKR